MQHYIGILTIGCIPLGPSDSPITHSRTEDWGPQPFPSDSLHPAQTPPPSPQATQGTRGRSSPESAGGMRDEQGPLLIPTEHAKKKHTGDFLLLCQARDCPALEETQITRQIFRWIHPIHTDNSPGHQVQPSPYTTKPTTTTPLLNTSRDGDSATSLDQPVPILTTLSVKKSFLTSSLNLSWCNLRCPHIL